MPAYSKTSKQRLSTCHKDLRLIFNTVIAHFDNSILEGHRGESEQMEAYHNGKSQLKWPEV